MNNRFLGVYGEELASKYLQEKGYKILGKNLLFKNGELDIVAINDNTLVFVEVKARDNTKFGVPIESITPTKIKSIISCAKQYVLKNNLYNCNMRFDVISILRDEITHLEDVFWAN